MLHLARQAAPFAALNDAANGQRHGSSGLSVRLEKRSRCDYPDNMNITLTPDQEAWLKTEIAKGHFATPEDAISYAINEAKRAALRETLNTSIARGGANSADDVRRAVVDRLKTG